MLKKKRPGSEKLLQVEEIEDMHGTEKWKKNEVEKGFRWNNEKKNNDLIDYPS